jgi:acyl-ACP thioesterase
MVSPLELTEIVAAPDSGRIYEQRLRPGIADVTGGGRARLDAIVRWLQDVAYLDLLDAGFDGQGVWIVRRMRVRVERFPRFGEQLTLRTFCSGIGRFSAERRTSIAGEGAGVETVSHWAYLDAESLRPLRFPQEFLELYGESAAGRPASIRLRHSVPDRGEQSAWRFRAIDLDVAAHVNNSHFWEPLEEELLGAGAEPESIDAEIEHHAAAQPGDAVVHRSGEWTWVTDPGGELQASIVRAPGA